MAVRARANLTILTDHVAERVLFEGTRAIGAEVAPAAGGETLNRLLADAAALEAYLRALVSGVWHAPGTGRMSAPDDPLAVTDGAARVIGVRGLTVCDGSIMPTLPRANTNVPILMIAERVADLRRSGTGELTP